MAKQIINTGTGPNSKNGDLLRDAFVKINSNFDELYNNSNGTISVAQLKTIVSQSTDFNDFKVRIANL